MDIHAPRWRKSSYSNPDGPQCVEVADLTGETAVRDTQNRVLGYLAYPTAEWTGLLSILKACP
ncbi:DUF397 domain-containing protein [Nocardiopsis exhalans]|uniref:DUF397 domain-containing protein n=1 Tax=Nocardiopsis exhalans TaxID=163604 RepID=A0ABY5D8N6_9ACTN|nr:DUF397 domain-containing protein [Nocardiopsis exhalans]USY19598.1 DUF397 domain-containing protein [Nocardiopsis exhalans]